MIPTLRVLSGPQAGQPAVVDRQTVDPAPKEAPAGDATQPPSLESPQRPTKTITGPEVGKSIILPMTGAMVSAGRYWTGATAHNGLDLVGTSPEVYAVADGSVFVVGDTFDAMRMQAAIAESTRRGYTAGSPAGLQFVISQGCTDTSGYTIAIQVAGYHWADGKFKAVQYLHLASPPVINGVPAKVGMTVQKGDFLGMMGNTGYSFGAHLHLIMSGALPGDFDPRAVFQAEGYSV